MVLSRQINSVIIRNNGNFKLKLISLVKYNLISIQLHYHIYLNSALLHDA